MCQPNSQSLLNSREIFRSARYNGPVMQTGNGIGPDQAQKHLPTGQTNFQQYILMAD